MLTVRLLLAALALAVAVPVPHASEEVDGDASVGLVVEAPNAGVQAAFAARSYAPGSKATLVLRGSAPLLRVEVFRAGAGHTGPLQGTAVGDVRVLRHPRAHVTVALGAWPSGLYYARVTTPRVGDWYAPFVVRPPRLGTTRVLVVLPTNTWQAYNFEDGGSWYLHSSVHSVKLDRPFIDGGVPPHYHGYDRGFLRWLALHGKTPDFLADDDLERVSGDDLARAYDLVIFSGHEEYATEHAYETVRRFRDLGGNLAFLSANNLFYRVARRAGEIERTARFRDAGEPEAAVVGAQYRDWNRGRFPNRPFVVAGVERAPWLFEGTGLNDGDSFGNYGIEIDERTPASPHGTAVLARVPDVFGHGLTAEMTYYTTPAGAKVFDAGVMNFGGSALWPIVSTMLENLWAELAQP
jgi:hypothetical protein